MLGMYTQMKHTDLIVDNAYAYVNLVLRLLNDEAYQAEQSKSIELHYAQDLHQNDAVALEWLKFIHNIVKSG